MAGTIYSKAFSFSVLATVTVLAGSIVMMVFPMFRPEMHPRVEGLRPLGALELAGRDVYQREGCTTCHTQTIRPLRSEVVRYQGSRAQEPTARYSLAGEFAYDHPFLWGSKRTGPDLAFEGWIKPSRDWHAAHFENPQALVAKSNMPQYAFLKERKVDPAEVQAHMRALRRVGVPYTDEEIAGAPAVLAGRTEMDAIVAYTVSLGRAVDRGRKAGAIDLAEPNPVAPTPAALAAGAKAYADAGCGACHGDDARGQEGIAPSLLDDRFLEVDGDLPDAAYFAIVQLGSDAKPAIGRPGLPDGGMPANELPEEEIWSIVTWLRSQKAATQR
jgi:cytochrome c oxidase cbb3-type subunit 2